jgi:hypothetical protein
MALELEIVTVFRNAYTCVGEWFNADTEAVINQALQTGAGPNISDAYTFNGLPGPTYNCSSKGEMLCPLLIGP